MDETGLVRLTEGALSGAMPDEDGVNEIRLRVFDLAAKRAERYAMGDSSVRVELFKEIVKSMSFTLALGADAMKLPLFEALSGNIRELADAGETEIERRIIKGRELLKKAGESAAEIDNISYLGVSAGIEKFFKTYDHRFFAHEIPGDIDYQLCFAAPEALEGIDYINEYLRRLCCENEFCRHFDAGKITALLKCCCADYRELLINIYEPAAVNALGLQILGGDIFSLDISESECTRLGELFAEWGAEGTEKLIKAAEEISARLGLSTDCAEYLSKTAASLLPRISSAWSNGGLGGVFVHVKEKDDAGEPRFIDAAPMRDAELRRLINEICGCESVSDKITLVKLKIHSMSDLAEVMNICFFGGECAALFAELGPLELRRMYEFIEEKGEQWSSESSWETELRKFLTK